LRCFSHQAEDSFVETPETRYAKTADGVYIAFQVAGEGPVDVVWQFDWVGNVDLAWEEPTSAQFFPGIASFARLILHDRRGTGLSSRNVPLPDLETRVADLHVVLDLVGSRRPVLASALEGGAPNVLFAASDPERVHSLVWWAPTARSVWTPDYPWGVRPEYVEASEQDYEHWERSAVLGAGQQLRPSTTSPEAKRRSIGTRSLAATR
jgi:pimeloyl-ACP methyl ester carboxylesterase